MRTKALLLTAAVGAIGVATSMAQVYSVNAVGYINLTIQPGFNLVANQLNSADMSLATLLPNPPLGTFAYKLVAGSYQIRFFDPDEGTWSPPTALPIEPGAGVFLQNPSSAFTWTLVGEVPQGNLVTQLPTGFNMVSSQVPQAGTIQTALGLSAEIGYTVYRYLNNPPAAPTYQIFFVDPDEGTWAPFEPSLNVGEAILLLNQTGSPQTWSRTFSVN
jgi:hypothetical protein